MATVTMSKHPVFESITGLTNTTFDPDNYREDRMATEAQIRQVEQAIGDLQARKEHCCKEIVTWRSYVRVVAENTGIVLSDWLDNMQVGTARRGETFTVEFALPHDSTKYFDDRSSYGSSGSYSNAFALKINTTGNAVQVENTFYQKAVGQATDGVAPTGGTQNAPIFTTLSTSWPDTSGNNTKLLLNTNTPHPLPQLSDYSGSVGHYYIYKDTDNKIKINVRIRNQYAAGEYLALFFTQFVQRK